MDSVKSIFIFFSLHGIINAKEWEPKIYAIGANATVDIGLPEINRTGVLEIYFSGYTGKQHFTNVMLYDARKNQSGSISINKNYTDRLEMIEMTNVSLRFLLLKVNFLDSGNYTASKDSMIKGKTSILVPRHRLLVQDGEPMILNFVCNITNAASIKIEMMISKLRFLVVKYNVTRANCTDIGDLYMDRIDSCALRDSNFSLTVKKVSFLDVGIYVAWNDMDLLTDSVFVEIEENNSISSTESIHRYASSPVIQNILTSEAENYKFEWFLISGLVVLVATGMVINVVGRLRKGKVSKTATYDLTHRNGGQNTANSTSGCIGNMVTVDIPEGTRMVLTENKHSDDLTNLAYNRSQEKVRLNGKHLCSTVRNVQIDPILISLYEKRQSDETKEYDHGHEYDEFEPVEDVVEQSYKYEDTVQHNYIILQPPATIPLVTRKPREQFTIADFFSEHRNGRKKSPSRVDLSAFCLNVSKESLNDDDCTDSNPDIGNRDYSNQAAHPSYFELKDSCLSDTMHSSNISQERLTQKKRNCQSCKY